MPNGGRLDLFRTLGFGYGDLTLIPTLDGVGLSWSLAAANWVRSGKNDIGVLQKYL